MTHSASAHWSPLIWALTVSRSGFLGLATSVGILTIDGGLSPTHPAHCPLVKSVTLPYRELCHTVGRAVNHRQGFCPTEEGVENSAWDQPGVPHGRGTGVSRGMNKSSDGEQSGKGLHAAQHSGSGSAGGGTVQGGEKMMMSKVPPSREFGGQGSPSVTWTDVRIEKASLLQGRRWRKESR